MARGRECHALQEQEHDKGEITEFVFPAFPHLLQALKQARGPAAGRTCWQCGAGKMLKKCCVLMQNLIFSFSTAGTVCPAICLPGKHKLCGVGWACWAAESRQWGRYSRKQLWGQIPPHSLQPAQSGTPKSHLDSTDTQHESSPCKMMTFIKAVNTCWEQLLSIARHQRAAGEAAKIPVVSPETQGTARQVSAALCTPTSSNTSRSTITRSSVQKEL